MICCLVIAKGSYPVVNHKSVCHYGFTQNRLEQRAFIEESNARMG